MYRGKAAHASRRQEDATEVKRVHLRLGEGGPHVTGEPRYKVLRFSECVRKMLDPIDRDALSTVSSSIPRALSRI